MTFLWPWMHWSLLLVPLLAALYVRLQQRRRRAAAQFGELGLLPAGERGPGWRRHLAPGLFLAGLAILLAALARPQMEIQLPRVEGIVMLVFDVSGSMAADDLKPSRMEASKAAARAFIAGQPPGVLVGTVAFSDNGFTIQPPTNDQAALATSIERLSPQRGTSLANGIVASLNTIIGSSVPNTPEPGQDYTSLVATALELGRQYPYAAIVLLTDGENTTMPDPFEAAQAAADLGVRIHTVGVGSAAGAILELDGFSVHTRLEKGILTQIAQMTGGDYFNAEGEAELLDVYRNITPQFLLKQEYMEVTALFVAAGVILLLAGGVFSLVWFGRLP